MKFKHQCILSALSGCILHSCGVTGPINYRYPTALSKRPGMYMPKPMSTDSQRTASYVSAGFSHDQGTEQNISDEVNSGYLFYNYAQTFANFSYSIGGYGFAGLYKNNSSEAGPADTKKQVGSAYFKSNGFYGYGVQTSACFLAVSNSTEFRPIGIELGYNNEFGDYLNYRKQASQQPYIFTDKSSANFTAGISTELIFHSKYEDDGKQFGFRFYMGKTLGNHNESNDSGRLVQDFDDSGIRGSFTYFMQIKPYIMIIEITDGVMFRLGYRF